MKKLSILSALLLTLMCLEGYAQTIRRVNNDPNITGVNIYATIQAAHNAAVAGDIIYVEPTSSQTYGGLICTKQLTIVGNGYADRNTIGFPSDNRASFIDNFTMNNGSQGSKITGISTNLNFFNSVNVPNITIDRCSLSTNSGLTCGSNAGFFGNNLTVTRCRLLGVFSNDPSNVASTGVNITIKNCILNGGISALRYAVVSNNIFLATSASSNAINSVFTNNIFKYQGGGIVVTDYNNANSNTLANNLAIGANSLPTGNGNINAATIGTIFISPSPDINSTDNEFKLAMGSPAIGTGSGGVDMGIFGGSIPYILPAVPAYPIITNFTTSGVGNSSTPLNVSITVRGNN